MKIDERSVDSSPGHPRRVSDGLMLGRPLAEGAVMAEQALKQLKADVSKAASPDKSGFPPPSKFSRCEEGNGCSTNFSLSWFEEAHTGDKLNFVGQAIGANDALLNSRATAPAQRGGTPAARVPHSTGEHG